MQYGRSRHLTENKIHGCLYHVVEVHQEATFEDFDVLVLNSAKVGHTLARDSRCV